jgi:hypothetical protein
VNVKNEIPSGRIMSTRGIIAPLMALAVAIKKLVYLNMPSRARLAQRAETSNAFAHDVP